MIGRADQRDWLADTGVSGDARLVWLVLALHANGLGCAWPSIERLAAEAGKSRSTIDRALRELRESGDLVIEPGLGRGNGSRYHLKIRQSDVLSDGKHVSQTIKHVRNGDKARLTDVQKETRRIQEGARAETFLPGTGRLREHVNGAEVEPADREHVPELIATARSAARESRSRAKGKNR